MSKQNSYKTILSKLLKIYPEPKSELNFKNPYELIVAVSLSAQTTDKKVNQVTPTLFKLAPDFKALSQQNIKEIQDIIKQINYYKTKGKHIVEMAKIVVDEFMNQLPQTLEELITLPGVGRKTASVILSELKISHTLPVDTHVFRVSKRLGISEGKNVLEVEQVLRKNFEPKDWRNLHHTLIFHGRRVCKAQNPLCDECLLNSECSFFKNVDQSQK